MRRINLLRAHGSPTRYQGVMHTCRCACCCGAQADYHATWKRRNRDRELERQRAYSQKYRIEHLEESRAAVRRWARQHPEHVKALSCRRRARLLGADGSHTTADISNQYERQRGRCFYCGEKVGETYHVDHVTPLALGGSNGPENLVIACPSCNLSKGAKHPQDFAGCLF